MKSMKRCILFIMLIIILLLSFAFNDKTKAERTYTKITVYSGDTLWSIAKKYGSNQKDIRKTIYDIKKINKLNSSIIVPGEQLLIPVD
ncbi:LysM peptidoglycan-binding domain-containing protein [Caloramator sp. E03]|uniref:cell division suppressor protein YneA n=1 Tax=Caloramator sp. E03 TaxID=2576307 RepID=UPI0011102812|nr:LysM peptidoglycan-binding domain-containing protein [Caloramator sp. E03]QCX32309.1 LysM peptidoglycan-binding domain-containing protein [Caloramator sp. E03]